MTGLLHEFIVDFSNNDNYSNTITPTTISSNYNDTNMEHHQTFTSYSISTIAVPSTVSQKMPNFRELVLSSYLITFTLGILGNSLVVFVISYYGEVRRKSVANYYILNLAAADLAFVFSLPFFCYATFTKNWPFGTVVCKVMTTTREVNRYASVYTLVALSVDRFLASFYYCARWRTPFKGKAICVLIWTVALGVSVPYVIFSEVVPQSHLLSCRVLWPTKNPLQISKFITYTDFVVAFLFPVVTIFVSYMALAYRTRRMAGRRTARRARRRAEGASTHHAQTCLNAQTPLTRHNNHQQRNVRRRPSVQMTRTVLVIVLTFVFCHAPNFATQLVTLHQRERAAQALSAGHPFVISEAELLTFAYVNSLSLVLVFISSCINPIIYGLSNRNFSKSLKSLIHH